MASSTSEGASAKHDDYKSRVMLGPLPDDFLVASADPTTQRSQQEENDHAMAAQLQMMGNNYVYVQKLTVTIVSASLNKNYGLTRMDPYCRLFFGSQVLETQTDVNGAKQPMWNKSFHFYHVPRGITNFRLEVYDERSLTDDERIAWTTITIPDTLYTSSEHRVDTWFDLSGRIGNNLEGKIHVMMNYVEAHPLPVNQGVAMQSVPHTRPHGDPINVYQLPQSPPQRPPPQITEEDVNQVKAMFPDTESDVVRSVLEASAGNKEAAIEALLSMQTSN